MNIAIDLRALQSGNISGVEMFVSELTRALCRHFPQERFFLWTNSSAALPPDFPEFPFPNAARVATGFSNSFLLATAALFRRPHLDQLIRKQALKTGVLLPEEQIDLLLVLDPRPAPVSSVCPKVTVVHDLSPVHFPQNFTFKTRFWHFCLRLRREFREAAALLTPSRFTKEDVVRQFDVPSEKIAVIGAGAAENLRLVDDQIELDAVRHKYQLPDHFLLTLSTLEPRKNLPNLIEAFQRFQHKHKAADFHLVIAGRQNEAIFQRLQLSEMPTLHFPGFIAEDDKAALYSAATAFIYPSFFEGFGIPVLEAMACGKPILAAATTSLPEVYGDAALTFDPFKVSEIAEAIETIYLNRKVREKLAAQGLERAQSRQFSWQTVAEKTMAIVCEVVEKNGQH